MTARFPPLLRSLLFAQACLAAGLVVGAPKSDEPRAVLRLMVDEEPTGPAMTTPPPSPPLQSAEVEESFFSHASGDELIIDSPDLYESTAPSDPVPHYEFDPPIYEEIQSSASHRRRLAQYFENRPRQAPLVGESWLNRPYSWGFFLGGMLLDDPRPGVVDGDAGVMLGGRLGWDFAVNWGVEGRWAVAKPGLRSLIGNPDVANANVFLADMNWLWYPTGDTRWRPFFKFGFGYFDIDYFDGTGFRQHNAAFEVPLGVGMKYHHSSRLSMRFDLTDNFAAATGLQSSMHNLSITSGFEWHWGGGMRRNYWPWNPGRDYR